MADARTLAEIRNEIAWTAWHESTGTKAETERIYEVARACQIRLERLVALQAVWAAAAYRSHALRCDCFLCRGERG